jgi:outer membrane protein assembly factor BamB
VAVFGRGKDGLVRRGHLEGAGDWSHMYADAGNTACSGDTRIGSQLQMQWFGPPGPREMIDRHHRTVAPLYKNGRMFIPGEDRVIAVDAYNGTILWDLAVPDSRRVVSYRDCSYLVASNELVYVVNRDHCLVMDAQTGAMKRTFPVPPGPDNRKQDWGYVCPIGDLLVGSAVKPGSSRRGQSRRIDETETYYDFVPLVCSDFLFAYDDQRDGKQRWTYRPPAGLIVNPTIAVANDKIYFIESTNPETLMKPIGRATLAELVGKGSKLTALDATTGKAAWSKPAKLEALQHNLFLAVSAGKIVVSGSRNSGADKKTATVLYDIHVFDAKTGEMKWTKTMDTKLPIGGDHGEQDQHPVIVDGRLYCEPFAYNLHTGDPIDWNWPWLGKKRSGCGNISASASMFFFRNDTVGMFDLSSSQAKKVTTETRPGCWINLIPAGGLLLAPEASSGCSCNFSIQTSLALIPVLPPAKDAGK